jgi:hypothetical protein
MAKELLSLHVHRGGGEGYIRKSKAADQREQLVSLNVSGWDLVQQQYNISQQSFRAKWTESNGGVSVDVVYLAALLRVLVANLFTMLW